MKFARHLLPILLTISVTSFSASLLYILLQKYPNRKKKSVSMKIKVPKYIVPVMVGRGGSNIQALQKETNTYIHINRENVNVMEYTCIIKSDSIENIIMARSIINSIINDYRMVDVHEICVAPNIWDRIVSKNSNIVYEIQKSTGARIMLNPSFTDKVERKITITGDTKQIRLAQNKVEEIIAKQKKAEAQIRWNLRSSGKVEYRKMLDNGNINSSVRENSCTSNFTETPLSHDTSLKVYVSAVQSPDSFWIQMVCDKIRDALDTLVSEMTNYYEKNENRELHTLKKILPCQMVAAKLRSHNKWYRGKILSVEDTSCNVRFVDYGYHEFIPMNEIFELRTDMLSLRQQAMKCSLANVKPIESEWCPEACGKFAELVWQAQNILAAEVTGYKKRSIVNEPFFIEDSVVPCIELYDIDRSTHEDINIGEYLVRCGLAHFEKKPANFTTLSSKKDNSRISSSSRKILLARKDVSE